MHIFHKWIYIGTQDGYRWVGGVANGIAIPVGIQAKQCLKCGKVKEQ